MNLYPQQNRLGLFYGYIIILVSFLILLISYGTQFSFGVFFKPVLTEFGWTRAITSGAYSLNMIVIGVVGIFTGRLSDRFGPRLVITVCGLLIGLGYLLMSQVSAIWHIYIFFGILVSIGMGGMWVPLMSTVTRWFIKRRGLANGIVAAGVGAGMVVMPLLANQLISDYSWQTSYLIFGFIVISSIVILAQFLRAAPDQNNILPSDADTGKIDRSNLQVQGLSVREALHTRQFWGIAVIFLAFLFGLQTVMVHIIAHATDIGISATTATTVYATVGMVSIGSKVIMGSLGDRIGNRYIIIIVFVLSALSFIGIRLSSDLWIIFLFAFVFGISYGGFAMVESSLVADFFGLRAHGVLFGFLHCAANLGGALGPWVAGRIFDTSGSYQWAFIICAMLGTASLMLATILKPTRR